MSKAEKAKATNPFTGETLNEYEFLTDDQLNKKIQESWDCFLRYRRSDPNERKQKLLKLADILKRDCDKFAETITKEMGKPIKESKGEVKSAIKQCQYFANHIEEFLKCEKLESEEAKKCYACFEPLGVIYHITPFNFPFSLQFRGTLPALAVGNTVVNKNPTTCPDCGILVEKAFQEAGFNNGEYINLIISQDQSECVIKNKLIRGVSFTGSTEGGSKVASLAGKYFKKNVMELGGSDPFIVLDDADLEKAVDQAVKTRLENAGQCCTSAKRFIIQESIYDEFKKRLIEAVKKIKVGDPMDESTQVGPMAKKSGLEKIQEQLEKGKEQGGKILYGGEPVSDEKLKKGLFFNPTIVEVTPDNPLFHEETFGPIFALTKFKSEEEAIKLANNTEFGLGGAIFSKDEKKAEKLGREIETGILYINHMVDWEASNPGGGVKSSGYGREGGIEGAHEFVNIKTVWVGN